MTADRPTGEQLVEELRLAAIAAGVRLSTFVEPLISSTAGAFLIQLGMAKLPTPLTIERVRALCEGRPIPSGRSKSRAPREVVGGKVSEGEARLSGDAIALRRAWTDIAHSERLPGETLQAAIRRLQQQQSTISNLGGQ